MDLNASHCTRFIVASVTVMIIEIEMEMEMEVAVAVVVGVGVAGKLPIVTTARIPHRTAVIVQ